MNILLIGGASGLGKAILEELAKEDFNQIYFTYANSKSAAIELENRYKNVKSIHCDFKMIDCIENITNMVADINIDILISNAAGSIHKEHFHKIDSNQFLDDFSLNVLPLLRITQEMIKKFRKVKNGKIINIISSGIINKPPIGWSSYIAYKSYLLSMSKSWATENIQFGITSNCISPAFMQTNLTSDLDERILENLVLNHPLKTLLKVEEVAQVVLFFVHCSKQINGTNFIVNAGESI